MALHADAIAQDRAAGVRAGRIDRDYTDRFPLGAQCLGELIAQRAFARAGRACHAHNHRAASSWEQLAQQQLGFRAAIFDQRRGTGERAHVAPNDFFAIPSIRS